MAYTPYYSEGWKSGEEGGTPITPAALNNMEAGIEAANNVGDPVTVSHGGTGATTAAGARTNLGITPANIGAAGLAARNVFTDNQIIQKDTPTIAFYNANSETLSARIYETIDGGLNTRLIFGVRKNGSSWDEQYRLPAPDVRQALASYDILTTKSPVTVAQGGTGAANAKAAKANLGAAANIVLDQTSETATWTNLYQALDAIDTLDTATVRMSGAVASKLTGGKIAAGLAGTVCRSGANIFDFMVRGITTVSLQYLYAFRIENLTTTSGTPGAAYRFTGTEL